MEGGLHLLLHGFGRHRLLLPRVGGSGGVVWRRPIWAGALLAGGCLAHAGCGFAGGSTRDGPDASGGWVSVWRDDFGGPAGSRVSSARWRYDIGTRYPGGPPAWGTHEAETYTASIRNVYLDGHGDLAIKPVKGGSGKWTSGRIETRRSDFHPSVGASLAFSARIRLPAGGPGYWPAFWMLGTPFRANVHDWPAAGELDAMENVNNQPTVRGTLHCRMVGLGGPRRCDGPTGLTGTYKLAQPAGRAGFHTYTVVWNTNPRRIAWYVDDRLYLSVTPGMIGPSTWRSTFGHGYFILLNVAIGGLFPGKPSSATPSGAPMLVDAVTVAENPSGTAGPPPN